MEEKIKRLKELRQHVLNIHKVVKKYHKKRKKTERDAFVMFILALRAQESIIKYRVVLSQPIKPKLPLHKYKKGRVFIGSTNGSNEPIVSSDKTWVDLHKDAKQRVLEDLGDNYDFDNDKLYADYMLAIDYKTNLLLHTNKYKHLKDLELTVVYQTREFYKAKVNNEKITQAEFEKLAGFKFNKKTAWNQCISNNLNIYEFDIS